MTPDQVKGKLREQCPQCGADLSINISQDSIPDFCRKCRFPLMLLAGKYRLIDKLNEGGFAILYKAEHIHLTRDPKRVIKIIKPEYLSNENMRARFEREVQVTSALSQRNNHIVRIYDDFGEIPNLGYFYVMEYLEGQPLNEQLDQEDGLLPLDLCYHLFLQLLDAMRDAHKEEIVHRDLKPHNLYIIERGRDNHFLKVIDFGIAKPIGTQQDELQVTQGILGTPAYMAPEQCINRGIGAGSDIYSMGVILYELLVGETPFVPRCLELQEELSVMEIMSAHLNTVPPPMYNKAPITRNIPWEMESVVQCALAKRPDERFLSVEEFEQAFLQAIPESHRPGNYMGSIQLTMSDPSDTIAEIPRIDENFMAKYQLSRAAPEQSDLAIDIADIFVSQQEADSSASSPYYPAALNYIDDNNPDLRSDNNSDFLSDDNPTELAIETVSARLSKESESRERAGHHRLSFVQASRAEVKDALSQSADLGRKVIEINRQNPPQRPPLSPISETDLPSHFTPLPSTRDIDHQHPPYVERSITPSVRRASRSDNPAAFVTPIATAMPPPSSHSETTTSRAAFETMSAKPRRGPRPAIQSALKQPNSRSRLYTLLLLFLLIISIGALFFFTRQWWEPMIKPTNIQHRQQTDTPDLPRIPTSPSPRIDSKEP
jgi:serine/threonine protein kinase